MLPASHRKGTDTFITYIKACCKVLVVAFLSFCLAFLDGKTGSLLGSATLPETPLGHKAQAELQRAQDCPLHIVKSLIILSSTSADLIGKNISKPLPKFPKEQVPVGLRNPCVRPAGISNEGPHSTSQQRAGIPLPRGVHTHG